MSCFIYRLFLNRTACHSSLQITTERFCKIYAITPVLLCHLDIVVFLNSFSRVLIENMWDFSILCSIYFCMTWAAYQLQYLGIYFSMTRAACQLQYLGIYFSMTWAAYQLQYLGIYFSMTRAAYQLQYLGIYFSMTRAACQLQYLGIYFSMTRASYQL